MQPWKTTIVRKANVQRKLPYSSDLLSACCPSKLYNSVINAEILNFLCLNFPCEKEGWLPLPLFSGTCQRSWWCWRWWHSTTTKNTSSILSTSSILYQYINISCFPYFWCICIRRGKTAQENNNFSPGGSEPFHCNIQLKNHTAKGHPNHTMLIPTAETSPCHCSKLSKSQHFSAIVMPSLHHKAIPIACPLVSQLNANITRAAVPESLHFGVEKAGPGTYRKNWYCHWRSINWHFCQLIRIPNCQQALKCCSTLLAPRLQITQSGVSVFWLSYSTDSTLWDVLLL